MNYKESVEYIYSLYTMSAKLGLDKVRRLLALLGNPQDSLRFVHVAGTNGKGSTTAMMASILKEAGYRTGLFVSPNILGFRERVQVDGEMIPEEAVIRNVARIQEAAAEMGEEEYPTVFETITALAMCYYKEAKCDVVCLEVGLGGRLDATNIISRPLVSVITSIGLDHTRILGDTLEKIAFEKCGIVKPGRVTVVSLGQPPEALAVIERICGERENRLVVAGREDVQVVEEELMSTRIRWQGQEMLIPLPGLHQIENGTTALAVITELRRQGFSISDEAVRAGMGAVRFPVRLEKVGEKPTIILDGAHNVPGAKTLADFIRRVEARPKVLLIGMLGDKDYRDVLNLLVPIVDKVVITSPDNRRALPGKELYQAAADLSQDTIFAEPMSKALETAVDLCGEDGWLFVAGSLYLVSDIRKILMGDQGI